MNARTLAALLLARRRRLHGRQRRLGPHLGRLLPAGARRRRRAAPTRPPATRCCWATSGSTRPTRRTDGTLVWPVQVDNQRADNARPRRRRQHRRRLHHRLRDQLPLEHGLASRASRRSTATAHTVQPRRAPRSSSHPGHPARASATLLAGHAGASLADVARRDPGHRPLRRRPGLRDRAVLGGGAASTTGAAARRRLLPRPGAAGLSATARSRARRSRHALQVAVAPALVRGTTGCLDGSRASGLDTARFATRSSSFRGFTTRSGEPWAFESTSSRSSRASTARSPASLMGVDGIEVDTHLDRPRRRGRPHPAHRVLRPLPARRARRRRPTQAGEVTELSIQTGAAAHGGPARLTRVLHGRGARARRQLRQGPLHAARHRPEAEAEL